MKVCWLTSVAAPYTIRLFEQIGRSVDLYVVMDDKKEANRSSEWILPDTGSFSLYRIDKNYSKKINELSQKCDILIDGIYLSRYGFEAVSAFRRKNKKILMAADGGIAKNRGFVINKIMSYLMNRHDCFLSSSEITDRYFLYYGVDKKKIFHYRFTSLDEEDMKINEASCKEKKLLRKELHMSDRFTMVSVGQPIPRKGFDILVRAYKESGLSDEINLFIIGGEAEKEVVRYVEDQHLKNVHFVGLLPKKELNRYYAASDLFILPTREDIWGLVIQEAMSFGLPVITSDNCVCGLHFHQINRDVAVCRNEDVQGYAAAIRACYESKDRMKEISEGIFESIRPYTIENSSRDILNVLSLL